MDASLFGQRQLGFLLVAFPKRRGVADDLNEFTGGSLDQRLNLCASFFLVSAGKSNLDELMTINGDVQFGDQIRRDAFLSEHDDGAQGMGKTAQIALLERGEWHE